MICCCKHGYTYRQNYLAHKISLPLILGNFTIMDAKMAETVAQKKTQLKERGLTVSNLLARAERMYDEVSRDVDFHGYAWVPEQPRWGQKKWQSIEDGSADLQKLSSMKLRLAEAARKADRLMRTDIAFDELCASVEKTTGELEAVVLPDGGAFA